MNASILRRTATVFALLVASAAHADVLINNLDQPVHNPAPLHNNFWYAQSFLTPAGDPLRVDLVTVRVGMVEGTPNVVARLLADNAGTPGSTVLSSFTFGTFTAGTAQNEALTPTSTVLLAPETTYWLLMGVDGAGGFHWDYTLGNGASGSGSFYEYAYTEDQTATWIGFGTEGPLMMRVDVTPMPVPEPASAWLLAAGLAVAVGARRRLAGR
jgi:hypothetical protein